MNLWIIFFTIVTATSLVILALASVRKEIWKILDSKEQPTLFTQQLNRRLMEEHTAELRKFNQGRKH